MEYATIDDLSAILSDKTTASRIRDYGLVLSLSGLIVDELVKNIAEYKAIDPYHQADTALSGVLSSIFKLKGFDTEILVSKQIAVKRGGLISYAEDIAEELTYRIKEEIKDKNHQEFDKELIRRALSEYANEIENMMDPDYKNREKQLRYFKFEVDAFIHLNHNKFAPIEAKMFTCPIDDETRILKRLVSPSELRYYIEKRKSLYFLMVFSFIYTDVEKENVNNVFLDKNGQESMNIEKGDESIYVPLSIRDFGLGDKYSTWTFHLCILDRKILKYLNKGPDKVTAPLLASQILDTIKRHQQEYIAELKKVIDSRINELTRQLLQKKEEQYGLKGQFFIPDPILDRLSKLKINIRLNYNLLKVHYMGGLIAEMKNIIRRQEKIINELDNELEQERAARLREREERLRERREKLQERREKLQERREKLQERREKLQERREKLQERRARLENEKEKIELELKFIIKEEKEKRKKKEKIREIMEEISEISYEIEKLDDKINEIDRELK